LHTRNTIHETLALSMVLGSSAVSVALGLLPFLWSSARRWSSIGRNLFRQSLTEDHRRAEDHRQGRRPRATDTAEEPRTIDKAKVS